MTAPDIDASPCSGEPLLESLGDGFSPPAPDDAATAARPAAGEPLPAVPGPKSAC